MILMPFTGTQQHAGQAGKAEGIMPPEIRSGSLLAHSYGRDWLTKR
jgi:hypothetical protein